jgi:hypothetical protein
MIGHKLPNKTKSTTIAESKLFRKLNNPVTKNLDELAPSLSKHMDAVQYKSTLALV